MRKGFTILELLIVIAVIAIIIGIALPRFKGMQDEGNIIRAKAELATLQTAVESYYMHNNSTYPAALTDLTAAATLPKIVTAIPTDPFSTTGATYQYVRGGTNNKFYIIWSVGPAQNGTASIASDDVDEGGTGASCIYVSNMRQDTQP